MNPENNNYPDNDRSSSSSSSMGTAASASETTMMIDTNNIHDMSTYVLVLLGGIAVAVFVAFTVIIGWIVVRNFRRRLRDKKEEHQRKCVYPYLQNMDANDVDIRRAPTGGWHGTYLNKLAFGVNEYEETIKVTKTTKDGGDTSDDEEVDDDSGDTIVIEDCLHKSNFSIDDDIIDDIIRNSSLITDSSSRWKNSLFVDAESSTPYCLGDETDAREKALVDNESFGLLVLPDGSNNDSDPEGVDRNKRRSLNRSYRMVDDTI